MRKSPKIKYLIGDVRKVLKGMPDHSVQCAVTSPPYWGLRDYEIPPSVWGGDLECKHEWEDVTTPSKHTDDGAGGSTLVGSTTRQEQCQRTPTTHSTCHKCGAWRGCLGLEPTLEMYVEHMLEVCRGLWRVLRDDGTFWLNLGDCYATSPAGQTDYAPYWKTGGAKNAGKTYRGDIPKKWGNLKQKDLVMMPARMAISLQADGWTVRSKVIWFKKNPMPESCTDRPTSSYEEIFELTKSNKPIYWVNVYRGKGTRKQPKPDYLYFDLKDNITYEEEPEGFDPEAGDKDGNNLWKKENQWRGHDYFYDDDAVREPHQPKSLVRDEAGWNAAFKGRHTMPGEKRPHSTDKTGFCNPSGRNLRNVWEIYMDEFQQFLRWKADHADDLKDVWKIATQPYPEAHFATFPEKIPETCIKAGTSEKGCCPQCGAPWERVEQETHPEMIERKDFFQPTCDCPDNTGDDRCVVLDLFAGSGTTLLVGHNMGRDVIGIDISKKYAKLASKRIKNGANFQDPLDDFK